MLRSVTEGFQRWRDLLRRRLAIWRWDRPNQTNRSFRDRMVFIRWDAKLGDTIVLSWVFREIKRQRPDLDIVVITSESFEELFRKGYGIESVYRAGKRHGVRELKRIASQLKNPRYVIHLGRQWRARDIWFVRTLDPAYVVGLDDELEMVNVKLGGLTEGSHFSDKLAPWLEHVGLDTSHRQYWIPQLPEASVRISRWWPKGRVVGLCPYGASRKRHLTDQQIVAIAQAIHAQAGTALLLLGRPSEMQNLKTRLEAQALDGEVLYQSSNDLFGFFEQIARCDSVVSVDTAVVHLACGLQKKLLAIYADQDAQSDNFLSWHPNSDLATCLFDQFGSDRLTDTSMATLRKSVTQWLEH